MPQTNVTFPDGVTRPVNHPEGASESEILNFAETSYIERFGLPAAGEDFTFSTAPSPVLDPSTAIFSGSTGIPTQDIKTQEQRELERLAEEQSVGREFADIPIQVASGALSAGEMISEVFGADNFVARQLEKANEYTRDFLSAQSKLDSMEMQRIMEEAQDEGLLDQVLAGAKAFSVAPLDVSAQALGTAIPAITGGIAGAAARLTPMAITGVQGGIGALMGTGLVKGTIYDGVQRALLEVGVSEELAHRAASEAQEYTGPNKDQIIAGAVLGALASTGPVERLAQTGLIQNVFSKIAANTGMVGVKEAGEAATQATVLGGMKNVIGAGLKESGYEFAQGAQEQIAENLALQRFGREYQEYAPVLQKLTQTPFARGVGTSGALEALGGFGVASGLATPFEIERYRRGDEAPAPPPVDPLALETEVSLEEEAEKRRKQEQKRQKQGQQTELARQQRKEEEKTLPLQGSEAVDMLPPDQVNPLRVRLSDPKRESEIPIQNIDDLAEGIPTADIEGVLEDGSAKQDVVNKALDDVVKVIKQGHRLEYGSRQEAERSALEQVRGKEAADLYERTVKERMSYAESLRTKDTDQMAKNWAKRSAKQISRELRTHFPRDEEFKVIQGRGTLVIVDSSGKAYTEIDGSLDNAFDLAYSLASELGSESKTRSAEWKKTGQVYDPDKTTVISGEDVAIKDVTGLPKQPRKKKYRNQKYTERQYRVASILARETGEMPIRADLENRTEPITDEAFESLSKRIADESVQETETEPLRLEDRNKEIREKMRKVLSGFGLDDVGIVFTDKLFGVSYDTKGNLNIDVSNKTRKKAQEESQEDLNLKDPLGGYQAGVNVIILALDAVIADIKGEVTKKKLIKALKEVMGHEIVHALRQNDLFTDQEWSLLSDLAVNRKKPNTEKTYMDMAAELNPDLAVELRGDALLEEAVADMVKDALDGKLKNFGGRPRSLVNRIYQFFLKLLNLKKDVGFETFEELIVGIQEGVVGSRERGVIRTKRQALRDQDETRAKTAKEFKEALKESEEAMTAAVTGEERDRAEDFDPDAVQIVDRPAFMRGSVTSIDQQITDTEQELYRLNSEARNDADQLTAREANILSARIQEKLELLDNLKEEQQTIQRLEEKETTYEDIKPIADQMDLAFSRGSYDNIKKEARKQGFYTRKAFYHGTAIPDTSIIRKFDPARGYESAALGKEQMYGEQPVAHFAYDGDTASRFAATARITTPEGVLAPSVYPVFLRINPDGSNIFDIRDPEGLFKDNDLINILSSFSYADRMAFSNLHFSSEYINKMAEKRIPDKGESYKKIKEKFAKAVKENSRVYQEILKDQKRYVDDVAPEERDQNKEIQINKALDTFDDAFIEAPLTSSSSYKGLPSGPTDRKVKSKGASFEELETLSPYIKRAGYDGYVDFEGFEGFPTAIAMFYSKDIKGIFAKFDPESVPEGMEYSDDLMFSRGSPDRGFNDRVQTSIPFRQRKIGGVLQPIEYTIGDAEDFIVGLDRARQDPKGLLIGKLAKAARNYNFLSDEIKALDDEAVLDEFKQHMIDNLIYLYNEMSPEVREIAKRWYDGARKLSEEWAGRYEIEPRQVAAVIANLSPQKDWFMNMSLAERLLDIMSYRQDYEADKAMNDAFKRIVLYTEKGKRILAKDLTKEAKTSKAIWSKIKDKKLSEVKDAVPIRQINLAEAIWVRMYDEAHNPRAYRKMSPDGKILDFQRKQNGEKADVAWGSFTEIAKAIIAAKTPDLEKISISLGKMHKVRNFYNNIIAPDSDFGEVTIDTHAVAAALLKPLSAKSYEVAHNFGSTPSKEVLGMPENVKREGAGGSGVVGSLGTYPIIADAYRDAASQLGILPRQLQSITWEQVRTLFPASFKDEKGNNLAKINKLWDNYASGDISLSDLREEIYGYTKTRRNKPTWTGRSDAGSDVSRGAETYDRQLSSRELPRQGRRGLEERPRSDVDDTPTAFSRKPRALASKEALEQNAAKNLEAAEKAQGRYIPRVNVDASLEAQYIANNPDSADTLDESDELYFSRGNLPENAPKSVTRAVNDLTGDPASPESPSEPFFRLLDMSSGEKLNYNVDKFRQSLIDKYARLARLYSRNPHLYKMLADTSAIDAAMLSEKATQFLAQTATKGVITYDLNGNGTTMVIPFERDGRKINGLIGVLKGLYPDPRTNPHGNLEKVAQTYAILKRSERLKREGKKVPETETTLAEFERDIERYVDPTTGENIIRRWYADWTAFNEYTITFLQKTGVVDEEISQLWKDYSDFIPFYRQAQNEPDAINKDYKVYAQKIFGGMDNIPKLQELKGSEKEVTVPMFDAIYTNLAAAIQMGMKNVAAQRITRDMISLGLAQKKSEAEAGSGYTVKFKHKGKIQTYEILDPLVYESMKASDVGINAYYATLVGGPANFLREAITRMPPFWAANIFRDSLSSFVTAGANTTPIAGALYHFLNPMQGTTDLEMMGIVGGYGLDVDRGLGLGKQMEKLRKKQGIFLEGEDPSPWDLWKPIWDGLEVFTNRSEAAVRREVFNDTLKRTGNIAEAQKQAIEVLNFARRGNNPVLKYVTVATPFLNARIQGMDLVYRALSGKTMPADRRSRAMALVGTYTKAAILLGSTMLYYMMVRDDEQYEEQSEMDKNLFYFFPTESGRPIRMPIPFEIGLIFKTIPELIMRLMDGTVTPREAATNLGTQTLETFSITPPQIVKPLVEVYFNRNFYTGRPIEPYYMDRKMQEGFKQRPTTNEFAKFLSQDLGLSRVGYSPLDVEHLLSGYGGTLGVYGMAAIDSIMKSEAFIGDKTLIKPYEDWRDNAMARRFFGQRFPSGTLERYYQLQKDVDQIVGSINAAQTPEERERRAAGRKTMLQTVRKSGTPDPSLANIKESVKKFRDQIRFIGEQDIDAQEKAKRIDKVKKQRTDYLNTYLPLVIEKYGLDVPLFNDLYIEDEKLIKEDLERARVIGSGRGGVFKTKIDAMMNP